MCHFIENSLPDVQLRDPMNPGLDDCLLLLFFFFTLFILYEVDFGFFLIQRCECKYVVFSPGGGDCTVHDGLSALVLREIGPVWC